MPHTPPPSIATAHTTKDTTLLQSLIKSYIPKVELTAELLEVISDLFKIGKDLKGAIGGATILNIARGKDKRNKSSPLYGKYQDVNLRVAELTQLSHLVFYSLPKTTTNSFGPDHCFNNYAIDTATVDNICTWLDSIKPSFPSKGALTTGTFHPTQDFKAVNKTIKAFLIDQMPKLPSEFVDTELRGTNDNTNVGICEAPDFKWWNYPSYVSKASAPGGHVLTWQFAYQRELLKGPKNPNYCDATSYNVGFFVDPKGNTAVYAASSVTFEHRDSRSFSGSNPPAKNCPKLFVQLSALWNGIIPPTPTKTPTRTAARISI